MSKSTLAVLFILFCLVVALFFPAINDSINNDKITIEHQLGETSDENVEIVFTDIEEDENITARTFNYLDSPDRVHIDFRNTQTGDSQNEFNLEEFEEREVNINGVTLTVIPQEILPEQNTSTVRYIFPAHYSEYPREVELVLNNSFMILLIIALFTLIVMIFAIVREVSK